MHKEDTISLEKAKYTTELLKFEGVVREKKQNLESFIYTLLTKHVTNNNTVVAVTGEVCCGKGKLRSLGDIFRICSYYYPGVRLATVKSTLLNFGSDLVGHYCGTVKRRVYTHSEVKPGFIQSGKYSRDEFGDSIEYTSGKKFIYGSK